MPSVLERLLLRRSSLVFADGVWRNNPIFRQVLGICSTLAVTNLLTNTLVMCVGLIYATAASCVTVSLLRAYTPRRLRMIVQTLIIAAYVIVFKILIDAYVPRVSAALGAYVGLIITNCIVMGRAEGFAQANGPWLSFVDAVACGVGYSLILLAIAFFRELFGQGTLFGAAMPYFSNPALWRPWTLLVMPPGAFFLLALLVWLCRRLAPAPAGAAGEEKP